MTAAAAPMEVPVPVPLTQVERMEAELLDLVREALDAEFYIELFPEDPDAFDDARIGRAALLQYRGSTYAPSDGLGAGAQTRTAAFVLHLVYSATTRTGSRAVKDIELLRLELQGRDVMGGAIELRRDGLAEQSAARRRYLLELDIAVPVVARQRTPLRPLMEGFQDP